MPHVDLETLLRCGSGSAAGDGRIACESLFPDNHSTGGDPPPPESFRLPVRDQLDWLDVHGHAFFDRSLSTKATGAGRLHGAGAGLQPSASASASSSRRAKKSAASFFVFPKIPDSGELSRRLRRGGSRQPLSRFLPKSSGRAVVPPISEPGSPKVTCIGRVRSIRDRSLHRKKSKRADAETKPAPAAKKPGFWSPILAIFRFRRLRTLKRKKNPPEAEEVPAGEEEEEPEWVSRSGPIGPAGIGGMKKFESGRRSAAWAENAAEVVDERPVWRRRAAV